LLAAKLRPADIHGDSRGGACTRWLPGMRSLNFAPVFLALSSRAGVGKSVVTWPAASL
jgi:hypothetical protein